MRIFLKKSLFFTLFFTLKSYSLGITSTYITLSPHHPQTVTLINDRDFAIQLQLDLVAWQQKNENDVYTPTKDLIASSSNVNLPALGKKKVTIKNINAFKNKEQTYRLFVEEHFLDDRNKQPGTNILLRLSIPVIVQSITPVKQNVQWKVKSFKDKLIISAYNRGNNLICIDALQGINNKRQTHPIPVAASAYILPGSKKSWIMPPLQNQKITAIQAYINNVSHYIDLS